MPPLMATFVGRSKPIQNATTQSDEARDKRKFDELSPNKPKSESPLRKKPSRAALPYGILSGSLKESMLDHQRSTHISGSDSESDSDSDSEAYVSCTEETGRVSTSVAATVRNPFLTLVQSPFLNTALESIPDTTSEDIANASADPISWAASEPTSNTADLTATAMSELVPNATAAPIPIAASDHILNAVSDAIASTASDPISNTASGSNLAPVFVKKPAVIAIPSDYTHKKWTDHVKECLSARFQKNTKAAPVLPSLIHQSMKTLHGHWVHPPNPAMQEKVHVS
jgi:hypothetical protein